MPAIRQLIPPLTLRQPHGRNLSAWDYKHKKNLIIAFLDAGCAFCEAFIQNLASHASDIREKEAVALVIFFTEPASSLTKPLPAEIIAGSDLEGHSIRRFLGEHALSDRKLVRRAVFVTDRYGAVAAQWVFSGHEFPPMEQILSALNSVEIACEECEVPDWPVDE